MRARLCVDPLEDRYLLSAGLQVVPYDPESPLSVLTNSLVEQNSGLEIIHASFVGISGQAGTYTRFDFHDGRTSLTLPNGILLTNGLALNALGPNDSPAKTGDDGTPGDPQLDLLADAPTFDANLLTLQFKAAPGVHSIRFDFVFGSEEFPVFVGEFNDPFGAFLDGRQISFDSAGHPVTVNNNFFQLDNSGRTGFAATKGKTPVQFDIQYNGLTPALTTDAPLDPSISIHTLTFAIADAGDHVLDSGVFLAHLRGDVSNSDGAHTGPAGNGTPPTPAPPPPPTPTPQPPSFDSALAIVLASLEEHHDKAGRFPIQFLLPDDKKGGNPPFAALEAKAQGRGPNDFAITLSAGQAVPIGEISGRVFEDYDGNGLQGANEPGLAGQTVFLDLNGNGYMDDNEPRTITNEKGEYRFLGLTPGAYKVRQVIWNHLEPTQPPSGERLVTLSYQRSVMAEQNFGAVQRTLGVRPAVLSAEEKADATTILAPDAPAAISPGDAPSRDRTAPVTPQNPPVNPGRKEAQLDPSKRIEAPPDPLGNMWFGSLSAVAALWWSFSSPRRGHEPKSPRAAKAREDAA